MASGKKAKPFCVFTVDVYAMDLSHPPWMLVMGAGVTVGDRVRVGVVEKEQGWGQWEWAGVGKWEETMRMQRDSGGWGGSGVRET